VEAQGYCGESAVLRLACVSIHRGEEPVLTGGDEGGGSGTIFVSGCNLGCVFCQNRRISRRTAAGPALGRPVDTAEFARICLALQKAGAENINIVTGSHAVPAIVEGISLAGPAIPVLWNSSAYELPKTLELLADTADVFLPDMKTLDSGLAARYFNAPDYPETAAAAIMKMMEMRPLRLEKRKNPGPVQSRLVSGVMVRHLVLPGHTGASREVLRWFAENCAGRALLSLMFQYTPMDSPAAPGSFVSKVEYETVLEWLSVFGIEDGYCQELAPDISWLPDFERPNPFSSNLSVPLWHWQEGFVNSPL
jgi:putative pyruvate formate lyase activating enzyme